MTNLIAIVRKIFSGSRPEPRSFARMFRDFKEILARNNQVLEMIADASDKLSGDYIFDRHYIETFCRDITGTVEKMVYGLENLAPNRYGRLRESFQMIREAIDAELTGRRRWVSTEFTIGYSRLSRAHADEAGNKNVNLAVAGNTLGLRIPAGFAVTA